LGLAFRGLDAALRAGSDALHALVSAGTPSARDEMTSLVAGLMMNFGAHSRLFIRAVVDGTRAPDGLISGAASR
jgi:hypothetical protein